METAMNPIPVTEDEPEDLQDDALERDRASEGRFCNTLCTCRRGVD